jgi:transcriptional regulator with XRE-family HTH domain
MTIGNSSAYIGGSVVNSLAHQKLLVLRQREADAFWDEKTKQRQEAALPKKRRAPRVAVETKAAKNDRKHAEKIAFKKVRDELIMQFISLGGLTSDWKPGGAVPPPNPKSQEDFAKQAGIEPGHYKWIENGQGPMTLDDAVKIARAYDMDISTFLLPDMENLEQSEFFDLEPLNQQHGPIYMYEWVLWIFGYRPLPGQDAKIWRKTTSLPAAYVAQVSGKQERDRAIRQAELRKIENSKVSAYQILDKKTPRKSDDVPRTPFSDPNTQFPFTLDVSHQIIKNTLAVATRVKVAFESNSGSGNKQVKRDRFSDSIGIIRDSIVRIVVDLLSLGR